MIDNDTNKTVTLKTIANRTLRLGLDIITTTNAMQNSHYLSR